MKNLKAIFSILLFFGCIPVFSQEDTLSIGKEEYEVEVEEVEFPEQLPDSLQNHMEVHPDSLQSPILELQDYVPWQSAELQGKLKMQGLPLSPSLKIFMIRDSLISISVRAPFVGEAGRLELTPDSILAVNKMKKTFVKEGYRAWMDSSGFTSLKVNDLQNLLLARFFLPGVNFEEIDLEEVMDIYINEEEGNFNILPKGAAELPGVKYGFVVDNIFTPLMMIILPDSRPETQLDVVYTYKLSGYDISLDFLDSRRNFSVTIELKPPTWEGDSPAPVKLDKMRQLSFSEFMKSF